MIQTLEAVVDESGRVMLAEPLRVAGFRRALVMVLDEPPLEKVETAVLSETALADWNRAEEDEAWSHLQ